VTLTTELDFPSIDVDVLDAVTGGIDRNTYSNIGGFVGGSVSMGPGGNPVGAWLGKKAGGAVWDAGSWIGDRVGDAIYGR
jgi:hypothetical protein